MSSFSVPLLLQTGLSFLVGATVVALATTLAERAGSTLGGLVGGMPSTALVALFFMGFTSSPEAAAKAAGIIPLMMSFCGVFLICYVFLTRHMAPGAAIMASILAWLCLSSLAYLFQPIPFAWMMILYMVLSFTCTWIVRYKLVLPTSQGNHLVISYTQLAGRGVFAGIIIAGAVLAAKLSGAVLGAILAGFPAILSTTLWISSRSQGVELSYALVTPLLYSCLINVSVYALLVRWLYPLIGIGWGTLLSYAGTLLSAYLVFQLLKRLTAQSKVVQVIK